MRSSILLGLASIATASCSLFSADIPDRYRYVLEVERPDSSASRKQLVLIVHGFHANSDCGNRALTTHLGGSRAEVSYHHELLVPPQLAIGELCRRWLSSSGRFSAVLGPGTRFVADYELEGDLLALHGDLDNQPAVAVLELAIAVVRTSDGTIALRQHYSTRVAIENPANHATPDLDATDLIAGWNRGLAELFDEIERDLAKLEPVTVNDQ